MKNGFPHQLTWEIERRRELRQELADVVIAADTKPGDEVVWSTYFNDDNPWSTFYISEPAKDWLGLPVGGGCFEKLFF